MRVCDEPLWVWLFMMMWQYYMRILVLGLNYSIWYVLVDYI